MVISQAKNLISIGEIHEPHISQNINECWVIKNGLQTSHGWKSKLCLRHFLEELPKNKKNKNLPTPIIIEELVFKSIYVKHGLK